MKLPPLPKWNKATDDIDANDLFALAQAQERSLLPPALTFPRTGQVWEAVRECEIGYVTSFNFDALKLGWVPGRRGPEQLVPPAYCGRARLLGGERVRVVWAEDPKPLTIWFQPVRYHELHEQIVPAETRAAPQYFGYRLTLPTAPTSRWLHPASEYFTEVFRRIEDVV
jgi:hypothetical protein